MLALVYSIGHYAEVAGASAPPVQTLMDGLGAVAAKALLLVVVGAVLFCGPADPTGKHPADLRLLPGRRDARLPLMALGLAVYPYTGEGGLGSRSSARSPLCRPAGGPTPPSPRSSASTSWCSSSPAVPILPRLRFGAGFRPGPRHLGRWSTPVGVVAVAWTVLSSALFMLPRASPITVDTFNHAAIALAVVLVVAAVWRCATARRRLRGPVSYGRPDEVAAMDLSSEGAVHPAPRPRSPGHRPACHPVGRRAGVW